MQTELRYIEKPKLKRPVLVAGLPGIAHIGKLAAEYLIHKLEGIKFAEIYSSLFPEWVIREDAVIKPLRVDFYYCRPEDLERDLILATAEAQAVSPLGQYILSGEILNVAAEYRANEVATMAAYVVSPHESRKPVVGSATDPELAEKLKQHGVELLDSGMIVGMNGLLVGLAWTKGMKGFCLLGTTQGGLLDIQATSRVLERLAEVLGFKLELSELYFYANTLPRFKAIRRRIRGEEVSYIG